MKVLILARHAKSTWQNAEMTDFERPLNEKGMKNAVLMGAKLNEELADKKPYIISSGACRALTTATIYAEAMGIPQEEIIQDKKIYHLGSRYMGELIEAQSKSIDTLMLVGHNPDISSFASFATGKYFENIPTSGIVYIKYDIEDWADIEFDTGELHLFDYPKKYDK